MTKEQVRRINEEAEYKSLNVEIGGKTYNATKAEVIQIAENCERANYVNLFSKEAEDYKDLGKINETTYEEFLDSYIDYRNDGCNHVEAWEEALEGVVFDDDDDEEENETENDDYSPYDE